MSFVFLIAILSSARATVPDHSVACLWPNGTEIDTSCDPAVHSYCVTPFSVGTHACVPSAAPPEPWESYACAADLEAGTTDCTERVEVYSYGNGSAEILVHANARDVGYRSLTVQARVCGPGAGPLLDAAALDADGQIAADSDRCTVTDAWAGCAEDGGATYLEQRSLPDPSEDCYWITYTAGAASEGGYPYRYAWSDVDVGDVYPYGSYGPDEDLGDVAVSLNLYLDGTLMDPNSGVVGVFVLLADPTVDNAYDFDADGDGFTLGYSTSMPYPVSGILDCDDGDTAIHPGAEEIAYDGIDQDCEGGDATDVDGDGHDAEEVGGDDCDDRLDWVYPGALDSLPDGTDADCDGVDAAYGDGVGVVSWSDEEELSDAVRAAVRDDDGDGWTVPDRDVIASRTSGPSTDSDGDGSPDDCDDADPAVSPGAVERPGNGADDDCDGEVGVDELAEGDLFVTELMPNPTGSILDADGEWFEIYNASPWTVDLDGMRAIERDGSTGFRVRGTVLVESGAYAVFARKADPAVNGGLDVAYAYSSSFWLNNEAADSFRLTNAYGTLDAVAWGAGTGLYPAAGRSLILVASHFSAADNDFPEGWESAGDTLYDAGSNHGTPGY